MENKAERLKKLDNPKLIDVVKNYRQYGYDENLRDQAISILEERGIDKEHLQLTGNFTNNVYDRASLAYKAFHKNSIIALIMYILFLVSLVSEPFLVNAQIVNSSYYFVISLVIIIAFWSFLIKSFIDYNEFHKAIGQGSNADGVMMYFGFGVPLYFLAFFYFRKQMKEQMDSIS